MTAEALIVESQFKSWITTAFYIVPAEFAQLGGNEIFYYYEPTINLDQVAWAWGSFAILAIGAALLALALTLCMNYFRIAKSNETRISILTLILLVPAIQLMAALQVQVTYYLPEPAPSGRRIGAYWGLFASTLPLSYFMCWMFCKWCNNCVEHVELAFGVPQHEYTPVTTHQREVELERQIALLQQELRQVRRP